MKRVMGKVFDENALVEDVDKDGTSIDGNNNRLYIN